MDIKTILIDTIKAKKQHQDYDYIVERTKQWRAIVSGKGLEDFMEQFNQREDKKQFDQRKRLTKQITSSVCKNVRDIEFKVPRSNSITRVISMDESKKTELATFNDILKGFWGDSTLDDYVDIRWIELNDTDPNSFIVLEWQPFGEDQHAAPYPFEVRSEEAVYYEYDNNKLQYLVALIEKDYTIYGPDNTVKFQNITDEELLRKIKLEEGATATLTVMADASQVTVIRLNDLYYIIQEPKAHKLGFVPAFQPGYMRDLATNGRTFLPPWWAAESVLMNLVKSKSELDLTVALHVFPQKFIYSPRCKHTGCNSGRMPDDSICPHCKGTGWEIEHTTAQDIVRITLPKDPVNMVDLDKLIHYEYPPVDLITFMAQYVKDLSTQALKFVYNSEIYSREQVAETATGKNIDMQAVYDTLYPLVKAMSRDWEFMVSTISKITQIKADCSFTFSKDFQLKSIDGYYGDLSLANTAGATPYIKSAIEDKIAAIEYADDKPALAKYFTLKAFHPFPGDPPEVIAMKMSLSYTPMYAKVLFSVFGFVFDELNRDNDGFYDMDRAKQYNLLKAKIESLIPKVQPPVFNPVKPVTQPVA